MHNHVHSTVLGATLTVFTKKKQQAGRCIFMVHGTEISKTD